MKWILIGCGVFMLLAALAFGGLVFLGMEGPDIEVMLGRDIDAETRATLEELELIEPGETIFFFYSDGFLDVREGMYFTTEDDLVLYTEEWDEPAWIIPYAAMESASMEASTNWIDDSEITVTLLDEMVAWFPVSPERGRDKYFFDDLVKRIEGAAQER